jgi:hypothetical protein
VNPDAEFADVIGMPAFDGEIVDRFDDAGCFDAGY